MSNDIFVKGACEHCAGHLEFPASAAGGTVPCPHCGQPTRLAAFASPKPPSGNKLWIGLAVAVVLIGAVGGVVAFLTLGGHGSVPSPPVPVPQTNAVVTAPLEAKPRTDEITTNDFSITGIKLQKQAGSSLVYVTGEARNLAARQRFGVTVEFTLYDTNDQPIGKAKDYQSIMESQGQWSFKAMVLESKTTYARFLDVTESQ